MWALTTKPKRSNEAAIERKPDGSALLKLPIRAQWPFRPPAGAVRTFELDEMGLLVWDSCDGQTTMLDVIKKLAEKYRLNLREAEVATMKFFQILARKRLIAPESKS